jgi:DNA polymerase I
MASEELQASPISQIQKKHILVDGDIVKYRCAASAEKTKYLVEIQPNFFPVDSYKDALKLIKELKQLGDEPLIWSRKEIQPLEFALQACKTALESLFTRLNPSKISIFLSPERTFRHDLARTKPYKGNRSQPKPKYLKEVEDYLVKSYGATFGVNVEADDEIGIALTKDPGGGISVSIDKDLLQIPGWHYNWVTDSLTRISPKQGDFNFYTQMLQGDITDNVPGIAGMGPVGAKKLLEGAKSSADLCSRVWNVYRGEFDDAQKARDYFFEQAKLLWILREQTRFGGTFTGYLPPIELK